MSQKLEERLNKILPKITSEGFLRGKGNGNEVAFYIFDYPPDMELRVRDYLRRAHAYSFRRFRRIDHHTRGERSLFPSVGSLRENVHEADQCTPKRQNL